MVGTPFFLGRDILPEEGVVGRDRVSGDDIPTLGGAFRQRPRHLGRAHPLERRTLYLSLASSRGAAGRLESQLLCRCFQTGADQPRLSFRSVMGRLNRASLCNRQTPTWTVTRHIAEVYPKSNKDGAPPSSPSRTTSSAKTDQEYLAADGRRRVILFDRLRNVPSPSCAGPFAKKRLPYGPLWGHTRTTLSRVPDGSLRCRDRRSSGREPRLGTAEGDCGSHSAFTLPPEADIRVTCLVLFFSWQPLVLAGSGVWCAPAWPNGAGSI